MFVKSDGKKINQASSHDLIAFVSICGHFPDVLCVVCEQYNVVD